MRCSRACSHRCRGSVHKKRWGLELSGLQQKQRRLQVARQHVMNATMVPFKTHQRQRMMIMDFLLLMVAASRVVASIAKAIAGPTTGCLRTEIRGAWATAAHCCSNSEPLCCQWSAEDFFLGESAGTCCCCTRSCADRPNRAGSKPKHFPS